jgi:hypothetical protein
MKLFQINSKYNKIVTNGNSSSGHFGRGRSDSTQVNQLIHNLEHNLHNPQ